MTMRICTIDGIAHYAKYLLRVKEMPSGPIRFPACEEEGSEGFLCFTDRELDRVKAWLKEQSIEYKIEELPAPPGFEKTIGVKYASRSEAITHIEQGTEPESLIIPRLRERVSAAEDRAEQAEQKALRAELKAEAAERTIFQAESRLQAAEDRLRAIEKDMKSTK